MHAARLIRQIAKGKIRTERELLNAKIAGAHGGIAKNSELLARAGKHRSAVLRMLRMHPVRTISGVAPVAVMSLSRCPKRKPCAYCPGGVTTPQSYTGFEPAARRAAQNNYDAYLQTRARISQLEATGHSTEKIELIIMGGTFLAGEKRYCERFVQRCFDAMNGCDSETLAQAHALNEHARHRCTGLVLETRPDVCDAGEALRLGATRIELGVQALDDATLLRVNREHTVADVACATKECKDNGLKVGYHVMPGLPGATPESDLRTFRRLFSDARFRPDMLKIYPCLVIEGTALYGRWKRGEYEPYDTGQAAELIADATRYIPRYCRVMRMQRDIPVQLIAAGVKKSNLTQLVERRLAGRGERCNCIRCREIGHRMLKGGMFDGSSVMLNSMRYAASGGSEIFLSFDDARDSLVAFARLRLCSSAFVRELRVYGEALALGERKAAAQQHSGYGARLLAEAERIAMENGYGRLLVTSGVGAREYYRKQGYERDGFYMAKALK